jgi:hypothetical protein
MLDDAGSYFYCALTDTIGVLHVDIKERGRNSRAPLPSLTMITESPILTRAGAPAGISASASNTDLRKPTTAATSGVNIRGMTDGQPFGCKRLTFEAPTGREKSTQMYSIICERSSSVTL